MPSRLEQEWGRVAGVWPPEVRKFFRGFFEKAIMHPNGEVTIRLGYFYRHGMTEDKLAEDVMRDAAKHLSGYTLQVVDKGDRWAPWPKDSYFWVRFSVAPKAAPAPEPLTPQGVPV